MGNTRIFLEQIDQSGASSNYVIAWNGTAWAPAVAIPDGDKGDITITGGSWSIDAGAVTLAKMATQATGTILGNNSGSSASPSALSATAVTAMLDVATTTTKGLLSTTDFKKLQAVGQDYYTRTLPTAVGNAIDICTVTSNSCIVEIGFSIGTLPMTKLYSVVTKSASTGGAWHKLTPYFNTGASGGEDFELDVSSNSSSSLFRVRRIAGTTAANGTISVRIIGETGATLTAATNTYTSQTVSTTYNVALGSYATQGRWVFTETAANSQKTIEIHNAATTNDTHMYLGMGYPTANDETGIIGVRKSGADFVSFHLSDTAPLAPRGLRVEQDYRIEARGNSGAHYMVYESGGNARVQAVTDLLLNTNSGTNALTLKTTGAAEFGSTAKLKSLTAAGAPAAGTAGAGSLYYQTDGTAGAYLSDGSAYVRLGTTTDLATKANLSGGNTFSGNQTFSGVPTFLNQERYFGPTSGTAVDDLSYFDCTNFYHFWTFRRWDGGAPTTQAGLQVSDAGLAWSGGNHVFKNTAGSVTYGTINNTGAVFTVAVSGSNLSGTNTGDQTITLTGPVTGSGTGSFATTIASNVVTNSMLSQVATATFKGRTSASTGNVEDLTATQATALLNAFTTTLKGLVPAPGSSTGKFLKDDGTWDTVSTGSASFIGLTDTDPTTFTGHAGKAVIVNAGATGLDFSSSALGSAAYTASTAYAPASHTHAIADVTGLQTALNNKVDDSQISSFALTFLDDTTSDAVRTTLELGSAATADVAAFAEATHTHAQSEITGLTAALSGKEPNISSGTTAQYWRGDKSWQALNKAAVGLSNVDNTSDANKPVSTAQQSALDLKAPINNPTFTGTVTLAADPTNPLHAATKQYVDAVAQGLDIKPSVLVATTASITLSGEQTIDGVTTSASRVLVKNQGTQSQNGIYLTAAGAWSRVADMDNWAEVPGAFVFVEQGTAHSDTGWVCTANSGGTLGTTSITWTQFSGSGTYTGSGGVTLNSNDFRLTDMAEATIKGRAAAAGTGAPGDLTASQVRDILPTFGGSARGLVPAPGTSTGKFLKDDGTWDVAGGGGGGSAWGGVVTATGTGTSQGVTLPEADLAPQDVIVFVDGIRWNIAEYTISGTTLTLTTNLAGESIQIIKPGAGGSTVHVPTVHTQNISGSVSIDCNGIDVLRLTMTGDVTSLTLTNLVDGKKMSIEFIQDATGGRSVTLSSQFKFGTDFPAYVPTTTPSKRDLIGLWVTGANVYVVGISKGY